MPFRPFLLADCRRRRFNRWLLGVALEIRQRRRRGREIGVEIDVLLVLLIDRPRNSILHSMGEVLGDVDLRFVNQCHSEKVQIIVHSSEMVLHLEKKHQLLVIVHIDKRMFIRKKKAERRETDEHADNACLR